VRTVVENLAAEDPRFRYVRQASNLGAILNLKFLLDHARHEYFMWAADDDLLEPTFIADLVRALEAEPQAALAMSGYDVVDQMSEPPITVSYLKHLVRLPAADRFRRLFNYVRQPEYYGKIRILWGLGRTRFMRLAFEDSLAALPEHQPPQWHLLPVEMRILTHGNLAMVEKNLFHSKILPSSDGKAQSAQSARGMSRMCRESFRAYRQVVREVNLRSWQKAWLYAALSWQEFHALGRVVPYYLLSGVAPKLGRRIKSLWFKILVGR